jgi:hypothetical protein
MAEVINGLNKIEQITLGEAVFGNGLNERLEQIDDNFQSIITSEYLKGDSGASFGYATFSRKLVKDGNGNIIYGENNQPEYDIVEPNGIYYKNSVEFDADYVLQNIIATINPIPPVQNEMDKFLEFEFTFIYEIINGKKNAKSSLPFVYYDPSIYGISQDLSHEDYSCIVIFDGEFKKLNAFPTIYYDNEDDKFYWKINGIETKLTATGPKGERGMAGAFNIVFVRKDEGEYIIEKFLYQNPITHSYSWIDVNTSMTEEDKRIAEEVLRPGSPCIALWGEGVETVNEATGENEITSIIVVGPIILHKEDINDIDIYHVQVWDHMSIQYNISTSRLMAILNNIGPQGALKGLYVPAVKEGDTVKTQHAIFKDLDHDNILNIKYVDNNFNPLYTNSPKIVTNYDIECVGCGNFQNGIISDYLENYSGSSYVQLIDNNNIDITSQNGIDMWTGDSSNINMNTNELWIKGNVSSNSVKARNGLEVNGLGDFKGDTRFAEKSRIAKGFDLTNNISFNDSGNNNYSTTFNTPVSFKRSLDMDSSITGTMDLSNVTITGSKKYQYVPIISNVGYSYIHDNTEFRITKFTMDPGNHIIYGIKFILKRAGFNSPPVEMGSTRYNFNPLNIYNKDAIDVIKTIDFGNTPIDFSITSYQQGLNTYLYTYVLCDGFISDIINNETDDTGWYGLPINTIQIS